MIDLETSPYGIRTDKKYRRVGNKIHIKESDFYGLLLNHISGSGKEFEEYATENFEKWFIVDPATGRMWLAECTRFAEYEHNRQVFVCRWRDVAAPLYDFVEGTGEYLGMFSAEFPLRMWLKGEISSEEVKRLLTTRSGGDEGDLSDLTEVKIVSDGEW